MPFSNKVAALGLDHESSELSGLSTMATAVDLCYTADPPRVVDADMRPQSQEQDQGQPGITGRDRPLSDLRTPNPSKLRLVHHEDAQDQMTGVSRRTTGAILWPIPRCPGTQKDRSPSGLWRRPLPASLGSPTLATTTEGWISPVRRYPW
jgi:hypothetical protein